MKESQLEEMIQPTLQHEVYHQTPVSTPKLPKTADLKSELLSNVESPSPASPTRVDKRHERAHPKKTEPTIILGNKEEAIIKVKKAPRVTQFKKPDPDQWLIDQIALRNNEVRYKYQLNQLCSQTESARRQAQLENSRFGQKNGSRAPTTIQEAMRYKNQFQSMTNRMK